MRAQPDLAAALSNLGSVAFYEHRYKDAARLHERALAIVDASLGKDNPIVVVYLNNLAAPLMKLHDYERAEVPLQRALEILERPGVRDRQHLGDVETRLGELCAATGRDGKALQHYRRAIEVRQEAQGDNSPLLIPLLRAYANLSRKNQDYAAAEKAEVRALGIEVRNSLRPQG